jgi:hypothetical protein
VLWPDEFKLVGTVGAVVSASVDVASEDDCAELLPAASAAATV